MGIGLTEAEFGLARAFNRSLDNTVDEANSIIDGKNREIAAARRIIAHLEAELAVERRKSADLMSQILGAAQQ